LVDLALKSESIRFPSYFRNILEVEKQLDPVNVKILSAMWKFGPRNLLEVSRRTGLPFTTVYYRVNRLESKSKRVAYLLPQTNRLGLIRIVVLVVARTGYEEDVVRALEIPNFWRSINSCEGAFTHLSTHSVPFDSMDDFKKYASYLSKSRLITELKFIPTTDPIPNFPDFSCYDPKLKQWSFRWSHWLRAAKTLGPTIIEDPRDYGLHADHRDLLIVKELQTNGRKSFAKLAPLLGISLQAVKYRYDRLASSGIIKHFEFDVYPFPVEISAYHEVMLHFTSVKSMNRFLTLIAKLFFVIAVAKVLKQNALAVRTYLPETQVANMFIFFSELAKAGLLSSYSSVRLNLASRQTQTISFELFDDQKGWAFDLKNCLSELRTLTRERGLIASSARTAKSAV
jgi:DNA-binding Lrp family transcriptional regulator